jgi:hypothetical protein
MSAFGSAITSSAFGPAIRSSAFAAIRRAFLTLGGVNETASSNNYTAVDGDVNTFKYSTTKTGNQTFFDNTSGTNRLFLTLGTSGTAFTFPAGVAIDVDGNGNVFVPDGRLSTVTMTISAAAAGLVINRYWSKFDATEFCLGVPADIGFAGSVNRFYPMSGGRYGAGAYELDKLSTLGDELWSNSPTEIQAGWVDNGDDTYTHSAGPGGIIVDETAALSNGDRVAVTYTIEAGATGVDFRCLAYGSSLVGIGQTRTGPGTYTELLVISSATGSGVPTGKVVIQSVGGSLVGTISNISVKEAPNAMLLTNILAGAWDNYTLNIAADPDQWENAGATKIIVEAP